MLHHKSKSSMFTSADYNPEEHILTITFNKGGSYDYLDVPIDVFNQLKESESEGKFLLAHIKPKFKCEKQE